MNERNRCCRVRKDPSTTYPSHGRAVVAALAYLVVSLVVPAYADTKDDPLREVIAKLKYAVTNANFSALKEYKPATGKLYWAGCNSDVSVDLTVQEAIQSLEREAKRANVQVFDKSDGGLIETFGWAGKRPYLYFQFTETDKGWIWLGVCDSRARSIDFQPADEK